MTKNDSQIEAVLQRGGTVVVPNRQRAVAIGLAHARAKLAEGHSTWPAPDVLPFSAWLARVVDADRAQCLPELRRLGPDEEWLLWREAARRAADDAHWLQAPTLSESLRESVRLRRDWGLPVRAAAGPEEGFQARAWAAFEQATRALFAVSSDDWPLLLAQAPAQGSEARPLLFAGFEDPGSALRERIVALGGAWLPAAGAAGPMPAAAPVPAAVHVLADRASELVEAALWCRAWLERDPGARLLVIVPQLAQCRALATRSFARVLQAAALLDDEPTEPPFALEGGRPLPDHPLAQAALGLWALLAGQQDFQPLSALLRTPYLSLAAGAECQALELQLRERNVTRASLASLAQFCAARAPALHASLQALQSDLQSDLQSGPARDTAEGWAPRLAHCLARAGWPGSAPLGSAELQARVRCDELLGQFAQLGGSAGRLDLAGAVELISSLAGRIAFEAASDDVPVTITASTADPLVHYDAIRVLGLNSDAWPRPSQPDAFVAVARQRAAGIRRSTAAGQLGIALEAQRSWRARAGELVLSCARAEDDAQLQPSSLLGLGAPPEGLHAGPALIAPVVDPLRLALLACSRLEPLPALPALPWSPAVPLPGGTRALTLQSQCPFQAWATLRLGAATLREPQSGLPASERGKLLHDVLERTWTALRGSEALLECTGAKRARLVDECVAGAVARLRGRMSPPPAPLLLEIESRRLASLVLLLLAAEGERQPFRVEACEKSVEATLGGARIDVRIDRVDRLVGAGASDAASPFVVLDYKSGTADGFDPLEQRPSQAQLLAYALLLDGEPAALATVHLRGGDVKWRGAARSAGVLPGLGKRSVQPDEFPRWLALWRQVVPQLAREFAAGVATVAPRARACEHCHLAALCRVDPDQLAALELADVEEAGEGEGEGGGAHD
ncbi:MAG: hypothetical protein RL684_626 [Pseudomonadota bacterium]